MALRELIRATWGVDADEVFPLGGGMNSQTWQVDGRFVLKWVDPGQEEELRTGGELSRRVQELTGITTGVPLDPIAVAFDGGWMSLLELVAGVPLTRSDGALVGRTLATVHRATVVAEATGFFPWFHADAPHLDAEGWVRPAVGAARAELDGLTGLTWCTLHSDPAPEAFLLQPSGSIGLIDWTGATVGPALYDVASALMYVGQMQQVLAGYGPVDLAHLEVLRRFRWAVQAAYFSRRLALDDRTGITSADDNQQGLDDARRGLGT